MKASSLVVTGSLVLAVACGRTGLENDWVDADGASADSGEGGSGARGGRGSGGRAVSGGAGGSVGASGGVGGSVGATGGSVDIGGSGNFPGTGGSVGGSVAGVGGIVAGQPNIGGMPVAGAGGQPMGGQAGQGGFGPAGGAGMPPVGCGNGVVEAGEACDPGDDPSPPALELRHAGFRAEVPPLVGVVSANQFYSYQSASSHTGFEELLASRLFAYRWDAEEALSLVMHHGIDEEATGLVQPESAVSFDIEGLPPTGVVALSDEPDEFFRSTPTTAHADWTFRRNTDGGVIGGLPFPGSWHLVVRGSFITGVTDWRYLAGNNTYSLSLVDAVELVASDQPGSCRADCTVPACGDGRLDAGEVCDDGNDLEGDGCSGCRPELP